MKVTFLIEGDKHIIDTSPEETFKNMKTMLLEKYYKQDSTVKWLHFEYIGNKPLREFGRNVMNPGKIPLTMDYMSLSNFSDKDRNYTFSVIKSFEDPDTFKGNPTSNRGRKFVPRSLRTSPEQPVKKKFTLDLDDLDEFPSLS